MDQIFGFRRPDGSFGIRNHIAVIPSVFCANHAVKLIANQVGGAVPFPHINGCGQHGRDLQQTINTLAGIGKNPNFGAVLVIGLGCERVQAQELAGLIAQSGKPVRYLNIQQKGGTLKTVQAGVRIAREFAALLAQGQREPCPVSKLVLGLKCGGTDATSGIAANPALGLAVDRLIDQGGTAFLSELAELLGTEHIMRRRSETPEVYQRIKEELSHCEAVLERMTRDFTRTSEQAALVTPGNFEGGVSSVSEKALGGIHKSGSRKFTGVLDYAQRPDRTGLFLMAAAGDDSDIATSLAAGGAQIIAFTTGRGTPTGFPGVPVLKITGNSQTFHNMEDDIDLNAGEIIDGTMTLDQAGGSIYQELLAVASGRLTKAEATGHDELFSIGRYECY